MADGQFGGLLVACRQRQAGNLSHLSSPSVEEAGSLPPNWTRGDSVSGNVIIGWVMRPLWGLARQKPRRCALGRLACHLAVADRAGRQVELSWTSPDRKSTRLNSSH